MTVSTALLDRLRTWATADWTTDALYTVGRETMVEHAADLSALIAAAGATAWRPSKAQVVQIIIENVHFASTEGILAAADAILALPAPPTAEAK